MIFHAMELRYIFYVNALPEQVWKALLEGQPIAALSPGIKLRLSLEPGSSYAYIGQMPDGSEVSYVHGTVLSSEPNRRLEMTYRTANEPAESRVTYEIELEAGHYTKLTVLQDRFEDGDPNYERNVNGWPRLLSNLKSFVETGNVMNFHAG